jgi:hypothetical protein
MIRAEGMMVPAMMGGDMMRRGMGCPMMRSAPDGASQTASVSRSDRRHAVDQPDRLACPGAPGAHDRHGNPKRYTGSAEVVSPARRRRPCATVLLERSFCAMAVPDP